MADKDKTHPLPCEGGSWLRDPETGALVRNSETSGEAAGAAPPVEAPSTQAQSQAQSRKGKEK